ncbi:PREDICTED: aprataxin and PNK-like factor [Habropoda laboriosa]|uniref:aprataxin and PNK-like factor n=1 Tax=Habropoda laboriosa TaxID=597456 RepID=UPI00083CEAE8|nr:PREDICTED: aprataxin and PNK-like factor [Habropoda laboriosa]
MNKLQILRVDNDLVQKVDLQIGNNIIGHNVETGCDDERIVKHAVTINLTPENEMTITPHQVSSCYMKSSESPRWQLLKLGNTVPIKPGDVCSLVPHKCWFKIISLSDKMENNEECTLKRKANKDVNSNVPDKKLCSESGEGDNLRSSSDVLNKMLNSNNNDITEDTNCKVIQESQNTDELSAVENDVYKVENANGKTLSSIQNSNMSSTTENSENVTTEDASNGSTSATLNISREKCKYAEKCYRKNPQHKAEFSHPKDSDYDAPDNREECPYGTECYRTGAQHKMQFKHNTNKHGKRSRKQTQGRVSLDTLSGMEDSSGEESMDESVDESEYDPSSDELYSESEDNTTD